MPDEVVSYYLHLPELFLEDGNMQQGWLVYGLPSITSIAGLVHKMTLLLKQRNIHVSNTHFALAIKNAAISQHKSLHVCLNEQDSHYCKGRIMVDPRGTLSFELLIKVDINKAEAALFREVVTRCQYRLLNGNCAGGRYYQLSPTSRIELFESHALLKEAMDTLDHGYYWLIDGSDDLQKRRISARTVCSDAMENLMGYLMEKQEGASDAIHYLPAVVGFHLLEDSKQRIGAREALPHVHAEPMLGAIKLIPRVARKLYDMDEIFWRWQWRHHNLVCRGIQ